MFYRHSQERKATILSVYVDDIILTSNDDLGMNKVNETLVDEFEVKDLGSLRYFLGMEATRSKLGIFICQQKYTLDLLKEIGMLKRKPSKTFVD